MRLSEMVTVIANNEDCVLLKVKEECRLDLITLGTFTLTDDMFRLTKGKNHTITNFSTNGNSFSYDFGESGHTIISDSLEKEKELILECVENDFDIYIGSDPHKIKKSLNIFTLDDKKHSIHTIDVMYWAKHPEDLCVHKDGEFYKFFTH